MIPRTIYQITTPGSAADAKPVLLAGMQEYSPGQTRKVDAWRVFIPDPARKEQFGDYTEFTTYDSACSALANVFFGGDHAELQKSMELSSSDLPKL